jgi:hypothetical protein
MAAILGEAARNSILKTMKLQGLCCIPGYCLSRGSARSSPKRENLFLFFPAMYGYDGKNWKNFSLAWPRAFREHPLEVEKD